jgi:hypothetical protein
VRLKVKIVEPHFLSKRVISGLFLKAKTEEEEFAELNVQELGIWTEINEERVGPLQVDFEEQLGDFLVQLADVVFHVVHRDFVLVRLFQIRREDLPPVP